MERLIKYIVPLIFITFLVGCKTIPKDAFRLSGSNVEQRQLQSRLFETSDEIALLSAGIAVLQDIGYSVDETEKDVGIVTASKTVDATDGGQIAGAIFMALLGANMPIDTEQNIKVSFITKPSRNDSSKHVSRITFQRVIWNNQGRIARVETIIAPEVYDEFFTKLSKSVFLEANQI